MSQTTNIDKLTSQKWGVLYDSLKTIKNPDTNVLRQFLEAPYKKVFPRNNSEQEEYHRDYMHALQLKLKSLTKETSPIEKTMTRSQLFLASNPLWATNVKPTEIIDVLSTIQWLKQYSQKDYTSYIFDKIIDFNGDVSYTRLNELYQ